MLTTLPPSDLDFFAAIPAKWRKEADAWCHALRMLFSNKATKQELCRSMGCSLSTLNRKITAVEESGWRGLVPNYTTKSSVLPPEFIEYWKALVESYQRKTRPAYRELVRRWRCREAIPGYEGHPGWPNLPAGWSERSLYNHQPTKLELTALRHGLGRAIAKHAPKTLSTRVGLWPLSHIVYDDVKLDVKCHIGTSSKLVVPLQIGALDLLSGSRFLYGTKPQLTRADGTKTGLAEADMRFAFASQLYNYGIHERGTTIVIEHGTATLRDPVIDICKRYLGDKISFSLSGMTGKMQAIAGMGDGKGGGGNFRHKAALESLHNLMHNELAALPGQTGHDRDEPEFLSVMQRERDWLLRLARDLPEEVKALLRFGTYEFHTQFLPLAAAILDRINKRTDHDNEGWEELGFVTREYRLLPESNEWFNEERLLSLPAQAQQTLRTMAAADERCMSVRKLSPHEVFTRGMAQPGIIKPPVGMIAEILYQDLAVARECRDGHFTFEDKEIALGKLHYESRITRPDGREEELRDRQTYETVLNPFDPAALWIFDAKRKGAFLGLARRDVRATRGDVEATNAKFNRSKERLKDLLGDTRKRNTHRTQQATEIHTHNAAVISGHRASQAADKSRAAEALDASLPPESTPTHPHHEQDISKLF